MPYQAYVYKISITKPEGTYFYIGYHKGLWDSWYFNSSKSKKLKEDWKNFPKSRKIECVAKGTCQDMARLEYQMLTEVNAKDNKFYYNKSNGGGKHLKRFGREELIYKLFDELMEKKYLTKPKTLDEINKYGKYQVRNKILDQKQVGKLSDKIFDYQGDMSDWEPIIIFEDMPSIENHSENKIVSGNHRVKAANRQSSNFIISMPCQVVPKKVWDKLDEHEIKSLLLLFNPQEDKPQLPTSEEEAVTWIVDNYDRGINIESENNLEYCKRLGFSSRKIERGLMKQAKREILNRNGIPANKIQIDYQSGQGKTRLQARLKFNIENGDFTMACSSGNFKYDTLLEKTDEFNPEKKYYIYIYHTNLENRDNWENFYRQTITDTLRKLGTAIGNKNMFILEELPWLEDNPLFNE